MKDYLIVGICILLTIGFAALFVRTLKLASKVMRLEEISFMNFSEEINGKLEKGN